MKVAVLTVKSTAGSMMRLADVLLPAEREELASRLYQQALNVLGAVSLLDERIVVSTDSAVLDAAHLAGARILKEPNQLSHSHSAERGVEMALRIAAHTVLSAPIDVPLATSAEYEKLLETSSRLPTPSLIIVPSCDGMGTNVLVRSPPDVIASGFGPGSFERHRNAGIAAGAEVRVMRPPGITLDVDTPQDLLALGNQATSNNDILDYLERIDAFKRARRVQIGRDQASNTRHSPWIRS